MRFPLSCSCIQYSRVAATSARDTPRQADYAMEEKWRTAGRRGGGGGGGKEGVCARARMCVCVCVCVCVCACVCVCECVPLSLPFSFQPFKFLSHPTPPPPHPPAPSLPPPPHNNNWCQITDAFLCSRTWHYHPLSRFTMKTSKRSQVKDSPLRSVSPLPLPPVPWQITRLIYVFVLEGF